LAAVPITELNRAYYSPMVSGWAQAPADFDTEMSKAMLGQESSAQAIATATAKVDHDDRFCRLRPIPLLGGDALAANANDARIHTGYAVSAPRRGWRHRPRAGRYR
jgi:hypothetical protein